MDPNSSPHHLLVLGLTLEEDERKIGNAARKRDGWP